ncbi:MAG TPA: hypothetical protein VFT45_05905 [Longimicrobium sp.]|nr:hypothetical protein [Longimicrobium sp.]
MRKLQLNVEDLAVTSFETHTETGTPRGTVRGNGNIPVPDTQRQTCGPSYCGEYTCDCVNLSARTLCGINCTDFCSAE